MPIEDLGVLYVLTSGSEATRNNSAAIVSSQFIKLRLASKTPDSGEAINMNPPQIDGPSINPSSISDEPDLFVPPKPQSSTLSLHLPTIIPPLEAFPSFMDESISSIRSTALTIRDHILASCQSLFLLLPPNPLHLPASAGRQGEPLKYPSERNSVSETFKSEFWQAIPAQLNSW
jgi:hypothetical protein